MKSTKNAINKKSFFILIICVLASFPLLAQRELLQGKITNETDVEGIHILNLSSRYNTITDENGHFSITVKPLDTLLFSSIKYISKKVTVTDSIFERGTIIIKLQELVNKFG